MQWNTGGWFGAQLGSTAWILVAAGLSAARDLATGLALLAIFLAPNAVGLWLWRRRVLSCYASTQSLLALTGLSGLGAVFVLDRAAQWQAIQSGGSVSAGSAYLIVFLVVAVLMTVFYFRFGRGT